MKYLFFFTFLFSLNLSASDLCSQEPRGVHFTDTKIQIDVIAGKSRTNYKKVNILGKQQAIKFCEEQGYKYLHAYYWKRLKAAKNPHKPYHLTNIQCSNQAPRNNHGRGIHASGNDSLARAHRTQYFLNEQYKDIIVENSRPRGNAKSALKRMKINAELIDLVMNTPYCPDRYTVIKEKTPSNNDEYDTDGESSGSLSDS